MEVISVSKEEFSKKIESLSDRLLVLFFYVEDSSECGQMSDIITELQKDEKNEKVAVLKINASNDKEICQKFAVKDVPSVVFINSSLMGGDIADKVIGANIPEFSTKFAKKVEELQGFRSRLEKLINTAPVMLFMKGNPNNPKCGFSKQVTSLLCSVGAKYETFDILEDFEVREGLKKYSDWPTYPQLYVKGKFIGGLDVLRQYHEANELEELISVGK